MQAIYTVSQKTPGSVATRFNVRSLESIVSPLKILAIFYARNAFAARLAELTALPDPLLDGRSLPLPQEPKAHTPSAFHFWGPVWVSLCQCRPGKMSPLKVNLD